tara:strand:- start:1622 stop:2260 length:639 start_codon:yes stop_codon:yes gene_type:complete
MVERNFMDTNNEEFWNTLTHFIGLILALIGIPFLFLYNTHFSNLSIFSLSLFSIGLLLVYGSSTVYHRVSETNLKRKLKVIDHISVFYLILGSYAPVCLITLYDYSGFFIFSAALIITIIGTILKIFYTGRLEILFLLLYLTMGWLIVVDIRTLFEIINFKAKVLLIAGGISYTIGVLFYVFDKIKFFHSIWHVFVLAGSTFHYSMILFFII